jgi:anthranilate synthase component I
MPRAVHAREFVADGITPIAAYSCASHVRPGPSFLFESAPGPSQTSRYSIIGLGTLGELIASEGAVSVREGRRREAFAAPDVFEGARSLMRRMAPDSSGGLGVGRFLGAYGAAAFEFAGYVERLPRLRRNGDPMPDLHLIVPETVVVFDHFTHRMKLLTLADEAGRVRDDGDLVEALRAASIAPLATADLGPTAAGRSRADVSAAPTSGPFTAAVGCAKESIVAGEAFQIVLSQRWNVSGCARPFDVYRALRTINPSPYMFYLDLGWGALFGSSPEVLARLDGSRAMVRPLAGTRSRNPDPDEERRIAAQLKRDVKERAEHIMLVDLGRNDLGKTSVPGSVRVTDLLSVEYYSHVMHLVSEVRGVLQPGRDAFDLFAAVFPAGTVSGAPKIRAMELIAELEGVRRGFYAGSIGYFGFDGSMDTCITLRSAHYYGGSYHVQAGAGIVADSVPESEDRECRSKAGAVFAALAAVSGGPAA